MHMNAIWARLWFATTAACVAAGVVVNALVAAHSSAGFFDTGMKRAFNTFAFFTIQSNLLVGIACALLAIRTDWQSPAFRVLRLSGLVSIIVTGIVYHVALANLLELESWALFGDQLVHTVVPLLTVVGWLLFGPRRRTSAPTAWLSLIFPVAWLAFTVLRGAVVHWYPYPFIDVTTLGYAKALLNCLWVALLFVGLAAGVTAVDGRLGRSVPVPIGPVEVPPAGEPPPLAGSG